MIRTPKGVFYDYDIDEYGNVTNREGQVLHWDITKNGKGYAQVTLFKNHERYRFKVHRLVAWQYLPMPAECCRDQINHKDGNHFNNHVSNLEWVTASQNQKHAVDTGLCSKTRKRTRDQNSKNYSKDTLYKMAVDLFVKELPVSVVAKRYNVSKRIVEHMKYHDSYKHTIKRVFDEYGLR